MKSILVAAMLLALPFQAFAGGCSALKSGLTQPQLIRQLSDIGFSSQIATKIAYHVGNDRARFWTRLKQVIRKGKTAPWNGPYGFAIPDVITVYRGIVLNNIRDFNPNYRMFESPTSFIDVTPVEEGTSGWAGAGGPGRGFIVAYEIPVGLLKPGPLLNAYRLYTDVLEKLGITDLRVFLKGIEPFNR